LRASDSEFGQILQEVDEISKLLKSDHPDTQTMRVATHPAVWGAVKQALLDRELRYLALTDDLTCLFNRRGFFAAATQQLKLAQRNGQNLLLLFCDVDNLKKINDTYGHHEGDLALIRTADALEPAFRDSDILARLGGDDLSYWRRKHQPGRSPPPRLERISKSNANESVTSYRSISIASLIRSVPSRSGELMAQADEAMYEQKRNHQKSCSGNN
jgi:diguanylate cyclase (GGDEF)-like protein